jgi:DNA polymerase-3 subunit alpha
LTTKLLLIKIDADPCGHSLKSLFLFLDYSFRKKDLMYLIFDTETTGLPKNWNAPITDTDNWPRCVQIAWQLHDAMGELVEHQDYLIRPEGFNIPYDAEQVHGISTELAMEQGEDLHAVLEKFNEALSRSTHLVGQNLGFDLNIMGCEFYRAGLETPMNDISVLDTCTEKSADLCKKG